MMRQVGNIFIVKPENLKSLLEEGLLSHIDPTLIHPYIIQRDDFKSARLDLLFQGLALTASQLPPSAWEQGLESAANAVGVVGDMAGEMTEVMRKYWK